MAERMYEQKAKNTKEKLFTRNFTFLILGQISSLIGNYTLRFALSMYVLEVTGSASVFAGLLALAMLPTIFLSPFGGILADRANRRNIMVALDTLSGLIVLIAGLTLKAGGPDIFIIAVLLVVLSVLSAFESPTVQACIPQMLSGDNMIKGNATVSQVSSIAGLITPFLGSLFYTAFGIQPVFMAAVAGFFVTAVLECFIHLDYKKSPRKGKIGSVIKEDLLVSIRFFASKGTGDFKASAFSCHGQPVCRRDNGDRFSLFSADGSGTVRQLLRGSRKRFGNCFYLWKSFCGGFCKKALHGIFGLDLYGFWPVPDSLRRCIYISIWPFDPVCGPVGYVFCQSVWVQLFFHLCHFPDPGADPGKYDGKDHVLCVYLIHVRPACWPDHLRGAV